MYWGPSNNRKKTSKFPTGQAVWYRVTTLTCRISVQQPGDYVNNPFLINNNNRTFSSSGKLPFQIKLQPDKLKQNCPQLLDATLSRDSVISWNPSIVQKIHIKIALFLFLQSVLCFQVFLDNEYSVLFFTNNIYINSSILTSLRIYKKDWRGALQPIMQSKYPSTTSWICF